VLALLLCSLTLQKFIQVGLTVVQVDLVSDFGQRWLPRLNYFLVGRVLLVVAVQDFTGGLILNGAFTAHWRNLIVG
jgi:hypothetical protein